MAWGAVLPLMVMAQTVRFRDVTVEMNARGWVVNGVSVYGHGAIFSDISGDSLPDLYIANAVRGANSKLPETLYISRQGQTYSEEDGLRGVSDAHGMTGSHGIVFADYDNDGDLDIFNATTDDRIRLYRNRGDGFFTDYSDAAKITPARVYLDTYGFVGYGTRGIVCFDADNDGDLELYGVNWGPVEDANGQPWPTPPQPNEYYINNGDGTFTKDANRGLTPVNPTNMGTQGVTAIDIDNDGDMDVFVSHRNYAYLGDDANGNPQFGVGPIPTPNDLFLNDGAGNFVKADIRERGLYYEANDCNATTFADYDNDGDLDAFVVPKDKNRKYVRVYQNDGKGFFRNVTSETAIEQWGFTCFIFDVDNDGYLDVFAPSTREISKLYLNNRQGGFTRAENSGLEITSYDPRGGAIADIDDDGDLDIYYTDANKDGDAKYSNRLFRNESSNTNNWVKIWGTGPKGDLGAFGTKVWVFEKGHLDNLAHLIGYKQIINAYGYIAQDDIVQHFGIGVRDSVDVKIQMLDGTVLKTRLAAKRKFYFSKPQTLTKVEGDNQTGQCGKKLAVPLKVRVLDAKGKAVAGVGLTYTVAKGNGRFAEAMPIYTDHAGIAAATLILGSSVGEQRIQVSSPSMSGVVVEFVATAISAGPAKLELVSGAGQSDYAGSVLSDSIRVRVVDAFGIGQADHPVHFEVVAGNGRLKPGDVQILERRTNADGYAAVAWQLGMTPNEAQIVRISSWSNYEPLNGSPIEIQATALRRPYTAGRPKDLLYLEGNEQSGTVGQLLARPFVVQLVDSLARGCPNYDVIFQVTAGGGGLNGADQQVVKTDLDGIAAVRLRLGTVAGVQNKVKASFFGLSKEIVFLAAAVADTPAVLVKKTETDHQLARVNTTLPKPLTVQVTDVYGNGISGHPVSFTVTSSDGWINDQKHITVMTDVAGNAQAFLRFGRTPGYYTVSASALFNNRALDNSPALFTATAVSSPQYLHKYSPDTTFGVAGQLLPEPIRVRVTDELGYPIPNYTVNFIVRRGGGHIEHQQEILKMTDLNGVAMVTPTLGTAVGAYNNVFEVQAYKEAGQNLIGSPQKYYVSAKKSLATMLEKISGDGLAAQAGDVLPQPLVVRVLDHLSRPVVGHDVHFQVIAGGGKLGTALVDELTLKSDQNGLAQVRYRLGNAIGAHAHIVKVTADDGIAPLTGSPAYFNISSPYGQADAAGSQVTINSPVVADGVDECLVHIKLLDRLGNPVPNERVTMVVQGSGNLILQPEFPTNADGETVGVLRSTWAEEKVIRIYVPNDEIYLQSMANVQFIAGPPSRIFLEHGNYQNGSINSALEEPIRVCIYDQFDNIIADREVYFVPLPNCGRVEPAEKQMTDKNGRAQVNWILGPIIGMQQLQVSVMGMAATENVTAFALPPSVVTLTKYKGDGQFAVPGAPFSDSLIVRVVNGHQSPISGLDVTFTVLQGNAVVNGSPTVKSNTYGLAGVQLVAGARTGAIKIRAAVNEKSYVDFNCAISNSLPQNMILVYGNGLSGTVMNLVHPLSVRVTDNDDHPVANVPIHFSCETLEGTVEEAQPLLTDNDGLATATVKLGARAGEYIFLATNAALKGSPITFRINALPDVVSSIKIYSGNNQSARASQPLASPIKVRLSDRYDNGIANEPVAFEVLSGNGSIYPFSMNTDAQGIAGTTWRLGNFGIQQVRATTEKLVGQAVIFNATVIENIPPIIRSLSDTTIVETQTLAFEVDALDPDGAVLTLDGLNLPPGASFDAFNTRLFIWRPEFEQQGEYIVIFRAVDNDGSVSQKSVTIRVKNLNRPPTIFSYMPENYAISTTAFKPIRFQVQAADQDGDSLRYRWFIDQLLIGRNPEMTIFPTPHMPAQFNVSVTVDDKVDSVRQEWLVQLLTSVELSFFRVEAMQGCNRLLWSCRYQNDHLGFNILCAQSEQGPYTRINSELIKMTDGPDYEYVDRPSDTSSRLYYQLQAIAIDGSTQLFGPIEAAPQIPERTRLAQNYPNPFNPFTNIQFELAQSQRVEIKIYDISGRLVRNLYHQEAKAGYHRLIWDGLSDAGTPVPSGIYYAILSGPDMHQRIKLVLVK